MGDVFDADSGPPGDALTAGARRRPWTSCWSGGRPAARTGLADSDRLLSGRPLLTPAAVAGLLALLACGAGVVLVNNFDPAKFWRRVADERVTVAVLDPDQAAALRDAALTL